MLAIAQCRARKKEWGKALDAYQSYLNKFPDGSDAEQAREQIAWIRMYHF
jgi:TolA-binding protein